MNNKIFIAISSVIGGALCGSVATYFLMKKGLEGAYNKGYNDCLAENEQLRKKEKEMPKKEEENDISESSAKPEDMIKEKLDENLRSTSSYASLYSSKPKKEKPTVGDDPSEEYFEEHQKEKNRQPKIISEKSLGDIPAYYDEKTLFYYDDDDVLVTEEEEEIHDRERFIGDALTKYGFADNDDEERIFVRNFEQNTVYEVQKVHGSWN